MVGEDEGGGRIRGDGIGDYGVGIRVLPGVSREEGLRRGLEIVSAMREGDRVVVTDGSCKDGKAAAAACVVEEGQRRDMVGEACSYEATAADAEFLAIILALEYHRAHPTGGSLLILSDNLGAINESRYTRKGSHLSHLGPRFARALDGLVGDPAIGYVPSHAGFIFNHYADREASRRVRNFIGDTDGTLSPSAAQARLTFSRQEKWMEWVGEKSHFYKGKPTRRMRKLENVSRDMLSVVFRLRTNKGWGPKGHNNEEGSPCPGCGSPLSSPHLLAECDFYAWKRPVGRNVMLDSNLGAYLSWIATHDLFGKASFVSMIDGVSHPVYKPILRVDPEPRRERDCRTCGRRFRVAHASRHEKICKGPGVPLRVRNERIKCKGCGNCFVSVKKHERGGRCKGMRS
jgi:ribonuclease HI